MVASTKQDLQLFEHHLRSSVSGACTEKESLNCNIALRVNAAAVASDVQYMLQVRCQFIAASFMQVFEWMLQQGNDRRTPGVNTFNIVITVLRQHSRMPKALEVFDMMETVRDRVADSYSIQAERLSICRLSLAKMSISIYVSGSESIDWRNLYLHSSAIPASSVSCRCKLEPVAGFLLCGGYLSEGE
jgi:pentatricopeptide repeat protein